MVIGIDGPAGSGKGTITKLVGEKLNLVNIDTGAMYRSLALACLRNNLTIIPQDPALMEGTLRYNIDPLDRSSDTEIVKIMEKIGFDYIVKRSNEGLHQEIAEGGSNLSVDEKQLICITRAILRKSKIIIMDEATASIDYKTEEMIQKAISELLNDR